MKRTLLTIFLAMLIYSDAQAATVIRPPMNLDESKIPPYVLPDPLLTKDGRNVDSAKLWNESRRPELLNLIAEEMYGKTPLPIDLKSVGVSIRVAKFADSDPTVFGGKGTRHQVRLQLFKGEQPKDDDPKIDVLIYTPNNVKGKVPAFLGLNFMGNHTVAADPGIAMGTIWPRPGGSRHDRKETLTSSPAKEEDRGSMARRWPVEMMLDSGFATATAYYSQIEPDFDGGIEHGVRRVIDRKAEELRPDEGNTIATWAWGLSMIRSHVLSEEYLRIDAEKIAVMGHSRLGKTALWTGASDPKFALVISNNSGCGGAALDHRIYGETPHLLNVVRPHWFCGNFNKYNDDVSLKPFDQHSLIALIAPRPVYVASAVEDQPADPKGEFLSAFHADPVYRLLGTDGIGDVTEMPEADRSVGGRIGYHVRTGKHDITEFDWKYFLDFAEKHFFAEFR